MKFIQNRSTRYRILGNLVPFKQYRSALEDIEECYQARFEDGLVDGLYFIGATGFGKSTIADEFTKLHPSYDTDDRTVIPVVSFRMPTACTARGLYQTVLHELGCTELSGTETALGRRLVTLLRACRVMVVLVDEAQHLLHLPSVKKQSQAADGLKALMNEAKVSMVLMGTSGLKKLMMENGELRRRFSRKINLTDWEPNVRDDMNEVAGITTKLLKDSKTPLNYEELCDPAFIARLIYGSGGRIAYVQKLLIHATTLAESNQDKKLQVNHFEKAFKTAIWDEAEPITNPFHQSFNFKLLDGPNQPFWREV